VGQLKFLPIISICIELSGVMGIVRCLEQSEITAVEDYVCSWHILSDSKVLRSSSFANKSRSRTNFYAHSKSTIQNPSLNSIV